MASPSTQLSPTKNGPVSFLPLRSLPRRSSVSPTVVGKIHGGYQLALITSGIKHFQIGSHPDPAHLTASFLGPAGPGKIELLLKRIKSGRNWTNIEAKLVQNVRPSHLRFLRSESGVRRRRYPKT
jgi:hypothetical protein